MNTLFTPKKPQKTPQNTHTYTLTSGLFLTTAQSANAELAHSDIYIQCVWKDPV